MVRKSSRGNPNHDALGRFCSAENCKKTSEKTPEEYEKQTQIRTIKNSVTPADIDTAIGVYNETETYELEQDGNKIIASDILGNKATFHVVGNKLYGENYSFTLVEADSEEEFIKKAAACIDDYANS